MKHYFLLIFILMLIVGCSSTKNAVRKSFSEKEAKLIMNADSLNPMRVYKINNKKDSLLNFTHELGKVRRRLCDGPDKRRKLITTRLTQSPEKQNGKKKKPAKKRRHEREPREDTPRRCPLRLWRGLWRGLRGACCVCCVDPRLMCAIYHQ